MPTKQFMSESLGWADNIILAMAPLGILTIILSAIRVGGPSWLKAVIGRARESIADVESELMSSTSDEVREFWDGHKLVKAKKTEELCEFVILLPDSAKDQPQPDANAESASSKTECTLTKLSDKGRDSLNERSQHDRPLSAF